MSAEIVTALITLAFFGALYFLPTLVASANRKKNASAIFILNLFTGWTFVGWVVALTWSVMHE